jgi:hypothetical protein
MTKPHWGGSRQGELFAPPTKASVDLDHEHPLVQIAEQLDWTEAKSRVERIRRKKLKNRAGRRPHLRALIGALILMAWRKMTYRDAEDQIRHYAPARYLCGLMDSKWTPDFTTIQDFHQLMGEDGVRLLNDYVLELAVAKKLANPKIAVADTTAQEAAVPYPNEAGLMATFVTALAVASRKAGSALRRLGGWLSKKAKAIKQKLRRYRFFSETKQQRLQLLTEMANVIDSIQAQIGSMLGRVQDERLSGYSQVAQAKIRRLHDTMKKLLPQIRYWLKWGRVATGKIVSVHLPEIYAIVRGKVGKAVEFGLVWGITRIGGGFVRAVVARERGELQDHRFVRRAIDDHRELFGQSPRAFAYDRGGYSKENVAALKAAGVRQIGLAPTGKAAWSVAGRTKQRLISERAQVEGNIGAIKSTRYGFNRPLARSVGAMGTYGQRAVLGFNLSKLVRELGKRREAAQA